MRKLRDNDERCSLDAIVKSKNSRLCKCPQLKEISTTGTNGELELLYIGLLPTNAASFFWLRNRRNTFQPPSYSTLGTMLPPAPGGRACYIIKSHLCLIFLFTCTQIGFQELIGWTKPYTTFSSVSPWKVPVIRYNVFDAIPQLFTYQ